jgi:hypothetical protein
LNAGEVPNMFPADEKMQVSCSLHTGPIAVCRVGCCKVCMCVCVCVCGGTLQATLVQSSSSYVTKHAADTDAGAYTLILFACRYWKLCSQLQRGKAWRALFRCGATLCHNASGTSMWCFA